MLKQSAVSYGSCKSVETYHLKPSMIKEEKENTYDESRTYGCGKARNLQPT